jgi:hypothetical protein
MKLDTIELFISDNVAEDGIHAISFVKEPAIMENWIALSQQEVQFKSVDDEQRIVAGIALKPDFKILRVKGDYKYNVVFSKETVKQAAHLYLTSLNNNNATLNHEVVAQDISVVESWVVLDASNDKSNAYKLNAKEGDWCVVMKVDNDEVWKDVKEGKYLGFSIEGIFSDRKINASEEKEIMTEERAAQLLEKDIDELTEEEAQEIIDLIKSQI